MGNEENPEIDKIISEMRIIIDLIKINENKINKSIKYRIQDIYHDFGITQVSDKELLSEFYFTVGMGYQLLIGKENKLNALKYFQDAEKIHDKLQNYERLFDVYKEIGISYYMIEKYQQADLFYNKALKLANDKDLGVSYVSLALLNLSTINTIKEEYVKSIEQLNEARNLIKNSSSNINETKLQNRLGVIYYNLAINYLQLNEFEQSVEHYKLANQQSKFSNSFKEKIIRDIEFITKDIEESGIIKGIKSMILNFK